MDASGYADRAMSKSALSNAIGSQLRDGFRSRDLSTSEMKEIYGQIKELLEYNDEDYVMSVMFPEFYPAARIPTDFPIPTAIFGYRTEHYVGVNSAGNLSLIFRPKVTGPNLPFLEIFAEENWSAANWGVATTSVNDTISSFYKLARLTAAVINVTYIGSIDQASGFIAGAVEYDLTPEVLGTETVPTFRNSLVEDGFYMQRTGNILEGMRLLWFPRDVLDQTFKDTVNHADSDALILYASGLSAQTSIQFRIDVERHFEAIPHSNVRDYIATAVGHSSPGAMGQLKQVPTKFTEMLKVKPGDVKNVAIEAKKPGFWESLKTWGWNTLSSAASSAVGGITSSLFGETIGTGGGQWGTPYANRF
jgi:hypothetical protein